MSDARRDSTPALPGTGLSRRTPNDEAVIWHDIECGGYDTDLPLWRTLADERGGPVLEIGCGTGRVSLELARDGHDVVGIDTAPALVEALRERARSRDLVVVAEVADVTALSIPRSFGLVVAPMQVLQLLDGPRARRIALAAMRERLEGGGLAAIAIVEDVPDASGELGQPLPDVAEIDGWVYSSLPLEIAGDGDRIVVTRLRQVVSPDGDLSETVDETGLAVLDAARLETEAAAVGLSPAGRCDVATTDAHLGSTVVLLEPATRAGGADG